MSPMSCHVTSCTIMSHHVTLFVTCLVTLHITLCRDVMSRYVTYFQTTSCNAIRGMSGHAITYHLYVVKGEWAERTESFSHAPILQELG